MVAPGVVEGALLCRTADAAGGYLGDVDVGIVFGGIVDVLGYGEGDGSVGDGFAEEPGYALLVRVSDRRGITIEEVGGRLPSGGCDRNHRRGFCSEGRLGIEEAMGLEKQTILHTPLRSCSVLSAGAAIVRCFEVCLRCNCMKSTEIWLLLQSYVSQWIGKSQCFRPMGKRNARLGSPVSDPSKPHLKHWKATSTVTGSARLLDLSHYLR